MSALIVIAVFGATISIFALIEVVFRKCMCYALAKDDRTDL